MKACEWHDVCALYILQYAKRQRSASNGELVSLAVLTEGSPSLQNSVFKNSVSIYPKHLLAVLKILLGLLLP